MKRPRDRGRYLANPDRGPLNALPNRGVVMCLKFKTTSRILAAVSEKSAPFSGFPHSGDSISLVRVVLMRCSRGFQRPVERWQPNLTHGVGSLLDDVVTIRLEAIHSLGFAGGRPGNLYGGDCGGVAQTDLLAQRRCAEAATAADGAKYVPRALRRFDPHPDDRPQRGAIARSAFELELDPPVA